jgi:hypothetical protein
MRRLGFENRLIANQVEGDVTHRRPMPMQRGTAFRFPHFFHDDSPSSLRHLRIGC